MHIFRKFPLFNSLKKQCSQNRNPQKEKKPKKPQRSIGTVNFHRTLFNALLNALFQYKRASYLGFKLSCKEKISPDIIKGIDTINWILNSWMQVYYTSGNSIICNLIQKKKITLVSHNNIHFRLSLALINYL